MFSIYDYIVYEDDAQRMIYNNTYYSPLDISFEGVRYIMYHYCKKENDIYNVIKRMIEDGLIKII